MGANVSSSLSTTTTGGPVDDSNATNNGSATTTAGTTGTASSADPTTEVNTTTTTAAAAAVEQVTSTSSKPFQQWTSEELAQAIYNRGSSDSYKQYSERVLQEGVDGSLLWSMKESEFLETLADLNVTNRLHVRVLLHDWKHAVEYTKRIQLATQLAVSRHQLGGKKEGTKRRKTKTKAGNKNVKSPSSSYTSTYDDYAAMLPLLRENGIVINPQQLLPTQPPRRKVGQRGGDVVERKKRRCLRCLKYGGGSGGGGNKDNDDDDTSAANTNNATTCMGRVGRLGGSKACMYFEEDGTPKKSST